VSALQEFAALHRAHRKCDARGRTRQATGRVRGNTELEMDRLREDVATLLAEDGANADRKRRE
jgi:hypothetical protein